jgi:hypothetical protein
MVLEKSSQVEPAYYLKLGSGLTYTKDSDDVLQLDTVGSTSSLGWYNVKEDYGAVGDGVTDDSTAIQNALNAAVTAQGVLYFPPGDYYIATGIVHTNPTGVRILGAGSAGFGNIPDAAANIISDQAITLMTLGDSNAASGKWHGLKIENLGFEDVSVGNNTVVEGLTFYAENMVHLIDVNFANIGAGKALVIAEGQTDVSSQYYMIQHCRAKGCLYSIYLDGKNFDINIIGGTYWGDNITGSWGLYDGGSNPTGGRIFINGTTFNHMDGGGIYLQGAGRNGVISCVCEQAAGATGTGIGIHIVGHATANDDRRKLIGCSISKWGTGVKIDSTHGVKDHKLIGCTFISNTTDIDDGGTYTEIIACGNDTTGGSGTVNQLSAPLHVYTHDALPRNTGFLFNHVLDSSSPQIVQQRARTGPAAVQNADVLATWVGQGYNGTAYFSGAWITFQASQTHSTGARGTNMHFYTAENSAGAGVGRWTVRHDGHLYPFADDSYDIGSLSDSRQVRDIYYSGTLYGTGADTEEIMNLAGPAAAAGLKMQVWNAETDSVRAELRWEGGYGIRWESTTRWFARAAGGTWANAFLFDHDTDIAPVAGGHTFFALRKAAGGTLVYAPTAGSADMQWIQLQYTLNQTGTNTSDVYAIQIAATETAVTGTHRLMYATVGGAVKWEVTAAGAHAWGGGSSITSSGDVVLNNQSNTYSGAYVQTFKRNNLAASVAAQVEPVTAATSGTVQDSPLFRMVGYYYNVDTSSETGWSFWIDVTTVDSSPADLIIQKWNHTGGVGRFEGDWNPYTDETFDLGSATAAWENAYLGGILYVDTINEFVTDAGVTIEGVQFEDDIITIPINHGIIGSATGGTLKINANNGLDGAGGNIVLFGSAHAQNRDIWFRSGTTTYLQWDYSITTWLFSDSAHVKLPVWTDTTRGSAGTAGRVIFNSDDGQLNIDDGTNWTLPDGTTT